MEDRKMSNQIRSVGLSGIEKRKNILSIIALLSCAID